MPGRYIACVFLLTLSCFAKAQKPVSIDSTVQEHKFTSGEIAYLEDVSGKLTFDQIKSPAYQKKFTLNQSFYPKNYDKRAAYWYRIEVELQQDISQRALFEFYDQTTEEITAFIPDGSGNFIKSATGAKGKFGNRLFQHKNFEFLITDLSKGRKVYYFRVRSSQDINVIIVYRTLNRFIRYGLTEYLSYGLFYGIIIIFSFHNLLMFLAVKRRQYLIYILYILSIGMYELSIDGIAFQYIWPDTPIWNKYAYGIALYCMSMFALLFTKELLHVKSKAPALNKVINATLALRTAFFLFCIIFKPLWFIYKFVDFLPLSIAFYTGIWIWRKGFHPARFFVMGYTFLFLGVLLKVMVALGYGMFIPSYMSYYSLSFCFVLEMVFLSFAIGDQVRILKRKKDRAQKRIMEQLHVNAELKDKVNKELETKVKERTRELTEKSEELLSKSVIIEEQNSELLMKNMLLEEQAKEISRINALLQTDNVSLKTNIEKVTDARALSTDMDFEEFSLKYPDREACYKFLAELKWQNGYKCIKCGNTAYCNGRAPYNRRCTKCAYEESVLLNTIFENNRIPINKAFYLVYLMYNNKGNISSHKLSTKLGIRQSTCWTYASRVKKVMESRKRDLKGVGKSGWSKLVVTEQ